jgi:hypothetical protein
MGLTYKELSVFGELRSVEKLGPWSCYLRLLGHWKDRNLTSQQIAEKVMRFFRNGTFDNRICIRCCFFACSISDNFRLIYSI